MECDEVSSETCENPNEEQDNAHFYNKMNGGECHTECQTCYGLKQMTEEDFIKNIMKIKSLRISNIDFEEAIKT